MDPLDVCLCGTACLAAKVCDALRPFISGMVADAWRAIDERSALDRVWLRGLTRAAEGGQ